MDRTSTNLWIVTGGVLHMLDHHLHVPAVPFCLKEHCGRYEIKDEVVPQYARKAYGGMRA
jgi:hypothetical protein